MWKRKKRNGNSVNRGKRGNYANKIESKTMQIKERETEREEERKVGREEGREGGREEGRKGGREEGRKGGRKKRDFCCLRLTAEGTQELSLSPVLSGCCLYIIDSLFPLLND